MKTGKRSGSTWRFLGGMCLGLVAGLAVGLMTENIGLWLVIGLGIGVCFGVALAKQKRKSNKRDAEYTEDTSDEDQ